MRRHAGWLRLGAPALCALALAACTPTMGDRALGLDGDDYAELATPPEPRATEEEAEIPAFPEIPPVPEMITPLAAPPVPLLPEDPLVTVSVTDQVPLKDVLFEMARQAGVDIEIDPRIEGGVVFTARDRPFLDVIDRIADLARLRWTVDDGAVRVEIDDPYVDTYRVPQLSFVRNMQSETTINTGLASVAGGGGTAGGGGGAGAQDTGSSTSIAVSNEVDFFQELTDSLQGLVAATRPRGLDVIGGEAAQVSVSRQTGVISVLGTAEQHRAVAAYLDRLRGALSAQVLIEGRVIEVGLAEAAATGIDWNALLSADSIGSIALNKPLAPTSGVSAAVASDPVELVLNGADATAVLRFLDEYGTVRLLSSPRVTILNNQPALLKVAQNFVYFRIEAEIQQDRDNDGQLVGEADIIFNSNIESIPIGFSMSVLPAIDFETDEVTLNIRPTITQISDFVADPALRATLRQAGNSEIADPLIPVVDVREIESVLKVQSGEVAVIGGLMQQRATVDRSGIPILKDIDFLNRIFGSDEETTEMVELVILLRATIVPSARPDAADRRLYERYVRDPRPIAF